MLKNCSLLLLTSFRASALSSAHNSRAITNSAVTLTQLSMTWGDTWSDILSGGNPRWKITDEESHQSALSHFRQHVPGEPADVSVLCPLAGDDPFVNLLWKCGYSITTIDLVPAAVEAMKAQFPPTMDDGDSGADAWTEEERDDGTVFWKHGSGRATLIVGDALQKRPELVGTFDAVYDKDSFGALGKSMRSGFCSRMSEYMKEGGIVYLECKLKENHEDVKDFGPPFSLKREELMEDNSYGSNFEYVMGLDSVYDLGFSGMKQTGHILRKK